jgi:triosephosphate isomerase (TIM)
MTQRKLFVGGNWKMNGSMAECKTLVEMLNQCQEFQPANVEVVVSPPSVYLETVRKSLKESIGVAAQNCYTANSGAYTVNFPTL